jgi:hypothetical protein
LGQTDHRLADSNPAPTVRQRSHTVCRARMVVGVMVGTWLISVRAGLDDADLAIGP